MCTLVLLQRPGTLLAVSGNRNELLARPASGPRLEHGVLAPRDELAHGSWLGLNRHGLFVCVTNRRGAMIDPSRKSRGLLVLEALQARSARGLHDALLELRGDRHNGFHLVYADLRDAFVSWSDGYAVQHALLAPGQVHVITERSFGAGEGARERSVLEAFAGLEPGVDAWRPPMTVHAGEPLESACVHADAVGYGTRSSLQMLVRRGSASALWTDGHPCVNVPRDISALASELLAAPG
ncbi:MAG: NRDE family protein [Deltaproteobacteria bacterium]|nr:MAG: NRDE family protein [Deltaproteobacteria bacterium]